MKKEIADFIRSKSDDQLISMALGSGVIIEHSKQKRKPRSAPAPTPSGGNGASAPRVSNASVNTDELVLKAAGEFGKGFSTSELADKLGLSPTQARSSLKRHLASKALFTAGKLRFARYATSQDDAELASNEASGG